MKRRSPSTTLNPKQDMNPGIFVMKRSYSTTLSPKQDMNPGISVKKKRSSSTTLNPKRDMNPGTSTTMLVDMPEDILIDILLKLPTKTILSCRCACRTLRNIITSNPLFAHAHFAQSSAQILLQHKFLGGTSLHLFQFEHETDSLDTGVKFTPPVNMDDFVILNSCNGFLCIGKRPYYNPVKIWNPITGECIDLPTKSITLTEYYGLPDDLDDIMATSLRIVRPIVSGFGYCRKTKQYKVVRILLQKDLNDWLWVTEVCTLGDKRWRKIENPPSQVAFMTNWETDFCGVFLNGVFHWLPNWNNPYQIPSFNFENERFGAIPSPPRPDRSFFKGIDVLEGCLCLTSHRSKQHKLQLWIMKDYGVAESWTMVSSISPTVPLMYLKNGERILVNGGYCLQSIRFCKRRRDFEPSIIELPWKTSPSERNSPPSIKTIAHVPSFVLLKDVRKQVN